VSPDAPILLGVAVVALAVGVALLWLWWRGGPHKGGPPGSG
jgi:hypothetical protein